MGLVEETIPIVVYSSPIGEPLIQILSKLTAGPVDGPMRDRKVTEIYEYSANGYHSSVDTIHLDYRRGFLFLSYHTL